MNDMPDTIPWMNLPGDSPAFYDLFFGPLFFEPYAIEVVKRIDPASAHFALEIAAGTGRVTRHIRDHLAATGKLIASDISDDMMSEAKKKLGHLDIEWQHINAQQLPFNDSSLDLVVCCFGYMFVSDKPKALAEAYRVLKPGAMLLFTTWSALKQNAISYISTAIAKDYLEDPLQESDNPATSMWDKTVIHSLLQNAGFLKISIEEVEQVSICATAKEAAYGLVKGGLHYRQIEKRNPAYIEEMTIRIEKELVDKFGAAPLVAPISAVLSQAWK